MTKTELLFSLCYFYSYLSCLNRMGVEVSWILQANTTDGSRLWTVDRCSAWPVAAEFRCGRAGERSAPR